MKTTMALGVAAAAVILTACGVAHKPATTKTPASASTPASSASTSGVPPQCPQIMPAVDKVARQAGINLTTGSMHYNGPPPGYKWALELGADGPKNGLHSPSPQVRQLTHDLLSALLDSGSATEDNTHAIKFITSLQQIASDCGV